MKCERCERNISPGFLTTKEFKEQFKVGDVIMGWSTRKECLITAIGEERILYRSYRYGGELEPTERVAKIRQLFLWEKKKTESEEVK